MPVESRPPNGAPGARWRHPGRFALQSAFGALVVLFTATACTDRQHRNPLDPLTANPLDASSPVEAVAGDNTVSLAWDYSQFDDLSGYRLHRATVGSDGTPTQALSRDLPPATLQFDDTDVVNGRTYQYRLSLLIEGEGERELERIERATPGREVVWAADRGTGQVWKLSPDGRNGLFARGRFQLAGLAVNRRDRSCWVSDGAAGLFRIDPAGHVDVVSSDLTQPGDLSMDPDGETGWIVDVAAGAVHSFATQSTDSLELVPVDASFLEPFELAAIGGGCWIADREQGRILLTSAQGVRLADWRGLADLQAIAAGESPLQSGGGNVVWALTESGARLLRLEVGGPTLSLDLPFSRAVAFDVDGRSGDCWVLGENDIALFGADGSPLIHWSSVDLGGVELRVDGTNDSVWIAAANVLWKFNSELESPTRLDGFASILEIEVDPGGP